MATTNFYIGTYTSPGGSEGVYRCSIDPKSGQLGTPSLFAKSPNPSFLARNKSGSMVYAVQEIANATVTAYDSTGKEIGQAKTDGDYACHLTLSFDQKKLLVANYNKGTGAILELGADGSIGTRTTFKNTGSGPNKSRQDASHVHYFGASPRADWSFICDLGTDEVIGFEKNSVATPLRFKVAPGGGPRHMAFHPKKNVLYVNNELLSSVTAISFDPKAKAMTEINTLPTLPPDYKSKSTTAEIAVDPSGKYVLVSNRGHDSIAVFKIGAKGELAANGIYSAGVKEPRGFAFDPTGKWVVVGGQNSNTIVSLKFDPKSGALSTPVSTLKLSKPVCILF